MSLALKYIIDIRSQEKISKDISTQSKELGKNIDKLSDLYSNIIKKIRKIQEIKPKLSNILSNVQNLEEYDPKLSEECRSIKEDYSQTYSFLKMNLKEFYEISIDSIKAIRKIMFDSYSSLYKEDKEMRRFSKKIIKSSTDIKLKINLLNRITTIKENMKSVARKIYEVTKAENDDILIEEINIEISKHSPLSDEIGSLGLKVDESAKIIHALGIDDIDEIDKKAHEELNSLKKIMMECMILLEKTESYSIDINTNLEPIEEKEYQIMYDNFFKELNKVKKKIMSDAATLMNSINIADTNMDN